MPAIITSSINFINSGGRYIIDLSGLVNVFPHIEGIRM